MPKLPENAALLRKVAIGIGENGTLGVGDLHTNSVLKDFRQNSRSKNSKGGLL